MVLFNLYRSLIGPKLYYGFYLVRISPYILDQNFLEENHTLKILISMWMPCFNSSHSNPPKKWLNPVAAFNIELRKHIQYEAKSLLIKQYFAEIINY